MFFNESPQTISFEHWNGNISPSCKVRRLAVRFKRSIVNVDFIQHEFGFRDLILKNVKAHTSWLEPRLFRVGLAINN
jgi:hypothetical protein